MEQFFKFEKSYDGSLWKTLAFFGLEFLIILAVLLVARRLTLRWFELFRQFDTRPQAARLAERTPGKAWMAATTWVRIGENMPKEIGDIGFPIVLHPRDPRTAWVFPMDGTEVWPRTCPDGKPAVYATRDAGKSWQRLDRGLPGEQAWLTVRRQAMTADAHDPVGIYFGTTSGEVWASADEGASWSSVARHLPLVHSVEAAELA